MKRSIGSPEHEVFEVPPPVTRSEILARVASQLIHEIAATAVGVAQPPPVVLPGKSPLRGSNLIDAGLDVLQYPPQQGRSLGQEDTIKAGKFISYEGKFSQNFKKHDFKSPRMNFPLIKSSSQFTAKKTLESELKLYCYVGEFNQISKKKKKSSFLHD